MYILELFWELETTCTVPGSVCLSVLCHNTNNTQKATLPSWGDPPKRLWSGAGGASNRGPVGAVGPSWEHSRSPRSTRTRSLCCGGAARQCSCTVVLACWLGSPLLPFILHRAAGGSFENRSQVSWSEPLVAPVSLRVKATALGMASVPRFHTVVSSPVVVTGKY